MRIFFRRPDLGLLMLGAFICQPVLTGAAEITVLNPRGIPPSVELVPMAPRLDTLEGKTVYFVDDGFLGGDVLLNEMIVWFGRHHPTVNTEFRKKGGMGFAAEDPALWAEIGEKGDAVIMATGH